LPRPLLRLILLVSTLGTPAASQSPAPQPASAPEERAEEAIIVMGERLTREQFRERAAAFIRGSGVASGRTPAARWAWPVCLKIIGLAEEQAQAVEARVRAIAEAARIPIARGPCETDAGIVFTADASALVREIDRRSPRRLAEVPRNAREALLRGDDPIRWWYLTDVRSRDGMGSGQQTINTAGEGGEGAGVATPISGEAISHYDSSIVSTQVHRVLTSATVVVDAYAVSGHTLDSIAAFTAMVAFAEIRQADFAPSGSILGLFASAPAPSQLTSQDLAFLRALYRLPLDREAHRHRGLIITEMVAAAIEAQNGAAAN
jgi:hypothetical protein